ncbi:MAG TPA: FMN-binding negative transcriptional regulator [Capsulimonadaceae bacterium]|jgi:transcriptional regulator
MYSPAAFQVADQGVLLRFMREHAFSTMVTGTGGTLVASHLPFVVHEHGEQIVLRTHMARANDQWRGFDDTTEALVIFQGPHAYVSPSWYASDRAVPTWNYAVVHAYGIPRVATHEELHATLKDSVDVNESRLPNPWSLDQVPAEFIETLMGSIVGVEIKVTRLEGKFKMSQNRSEADREGVVSALATSDDPASVATADWMRERV